jgi:hypothetical protein
MLDVVGRVWLIRLREGASTDRLVDGEGDASVFRVAGRVITIVDCALRIGCLLHGTDKTDGTDALGEILPAPLKRTEVAKMPQKWCRNVQIIRFRPPFYDGPRERGIPSRRPACLRKNIQISCRMALRHPQGAIRRLTPPSAAFRRLAPLGAAWRRLAPLGAVVAARVKWVTWANEKDGIEICPIRYTLPFSHRQPHSKRADSNRIQGELGSNCGSKETNGSNPNLSWNNGQKAKLSSRTINMIFSRNRFAILLSFLIFIGLFAVCCPDTKALAADAATNESTLPVRAKALSEALSPGKWKQVEDAVDRALAWIASQQQADGSFPTLSSGQPAVTSLCVMAFLSRGHQPGSGPYGQRLNRAIDFVLSCQRPDGLFSYDVPGPFHDYRGAAGTASYNHAIAGLMLGEVYGHVTGARAKAVKAEIQNALQFTRNLQTRYKARVVDQGGWRYLRLKGPGDPDSDLSITAWQLMFLRSAKNAEFAVPQGYVDEALSFVHRCWDDRQGVFNYALQVDGSGFGSSRGMMGAGILSLSLAGQHQTTVARRAGEWLLAHPYRYFGESFGPWDKFFYSTYYCSQAAAQLGGKYWEGFYPPLVDMLLNVQAPDGSWPPEPLQGDAIFGNDYSTAMAVLSLTPPYQLLPVYQR